MTFKSDHQIKLGLINTLLQTKNPSKTELLMKIDRTNTKNVKKLTIDHFMLLHPNGLQRPVLINSHRASHGSMSLFTHGNLPIYEAVLQFSVKVEKT